ncbi:hypothetical protein [Actinomyces weissii]|uniref:Uncharacterized protein n=1 Tax=Actinomyces weissii TaxID=675090 RepID=A0A7T7M821_9ACTO|nr:hypothetical protein [Actinomyces weissii]QQM66590.1 hypothetical protein JG540_05560 [Actinomyces weissii]
MVPKAPITLYPERSPLLMSRRAAVAAAVVSGASLLVGCGRTTHSDVPTRPTGSSKPTAPSGEPSP